MGVRGTLRIVPWFSGVWILLIVCARPLPSVASDWPHFRGPTHNGISTDRIRTNWTGAATNPLWRVTQTNSLTSLAVSGGKVFTQMRRALDDADREWCVAPCGQRAGLSQRKHRNQQADGVPGERWC